ncbi:pb1 domain containing protein [Stylonychia lemnae]|uniref:Pb1 domain containing protein n=1 Tax=Stylonychia lemnae TaxID=5949 RepID=A0A078B8H5_STYLE|nr:pb1 domain containing protein [Stylonychia lemnae]|eukprot:CDW90709.1 pb1 domain containing protein [Stylonychia lemnae]
MENQTNQSSQSQQYVKLEYNDDISRIDKVDSIEELYQNIQKRYEELKNLNKSQLILHYYDRDNDDITIDNNMDLAEAYSQLPQNRILKILIKKNEKLSTHRQSKSIGSVEDNNIFNRSLNQSSNNIKYCGDNTINESNKKKSHNSDTIQDKPSDLSQQRQTNKLIDTQEFESEQVQEQMKQLRRIIKDELYVFAQENIQIIIQEKIKLMFQNNNNHNQPIDKHQLNQLPKHNKQGSQSQIIQQPMLQSKAQSKKKEQKLLFTEIGRTLVRPVTEGDYFQIYWELKNENTFDWNHKHLQLIQQEPIAVYLQYTIKPSEFLSNQVGTLEVEIQAPDKAGNYKFNFQLFDSLLKMDSDKHLQLILTVSTNFNPPSEEEKIKLQTIRSILPANDRKNDKIISLLRKNKQNVNQTIEELLLHKDLDVD